MDRSVKATCSTMKGVAGQRLANVVPMKWL